jgi:preprotein translocase subunit SecG
MLIFFSIVHVLLCIFMVLVILLQPGKDAGMGAALGGGAATSAFGGRGAVTFLGKVTAVCASAFFLTSLGLSMKDLRQSVTATHAPPPKKVKPAETKPGEQGAAETPKVDPLAKSPAGPAEGDSVKAGDGKAGQPIPSDKPTGTEAVPAEKQAEQKK